MNGIKVLLDEISFRLKFSSTVIIDSEINMLGHSGTPTHALIHMYSYNANTRINPHRCTHTHVLTHIHPHMHHTIGMYVLTRIHPHI